MLMKPKLLNELDFPQSGEILSGHEVLATEYDFSDNILTYSIRFPRDVNRADVPTIMRPFFTKQLLNLEDGEYVVDAHDYSVKVGVDKTVVKGSIAITPVAKSNPQKLALTPMEDFNQEYSKMEENNP